MRVLRYAAWVLLGGLAAAAVWLWHPLPDNPPFDELAADAAGYDALIIRDQWGVPHIRGKTDADASFGLAYAHAEDDYETIQEVVAATRGVLASYRGRESAATDYIVALLDVWDTVERRYQNDVPDDAKAIAEAYAAGLNLYAARHPDQTWHGLAPFTAQDIIAGFVFKTPFFYGLDETLKALHEDGRESSLAMAPDSEHQAWEWRAGPAPELGSNAMAVNRARSQDGTTRLLINSHQPMTGPVAWYEAHLKSDQGLDITGGLFPGTPFILHGFNRALGWANTVNHIDLADVYVLTRHSDQPYRYRFDDEWLQFERETVTIPVKLFGPFRFMAKREVLRSRHGPVIENGEHTFALRYSGMGEIRQFEQYYRLNKSGSLDEFLQAMAMNALPSINYDYADRDDNIGFIHNAQYPDRIDGWDWQRDLPGDRSDLIWHGYRGFDSVPKLINPVSGFVFNANNTPYSATDGPDNLKPEDFPASMGLSHDQTNRALRLIELNDGVSPLGKAELLALKFDLSYSVDSEQYQQLQKIIDEDWSEDDRLQAAAAHLNAWNRATDIANRHAALAILTLRGISRSDNPADLSKPALLQALDTAVGFLEARFGRIDPQWGEVNRLVRGEVDLPVDGGPDILRAIYSFGVPDSELPYATHGDTWMALVEWSDNGLSADVLHQFGSATLDSSSPHYADQAPLFANQQWRKALIDWKDVEANAAKSYRPGKH